MKHVCMYSSAGLEASACQSHFPGPGAPQGVLQGPPVLEDRPGAPSAPLGHTRGGGTPSWLQWPLPAALSQQVSPHGCRVACRLGHVFSTLAGHSPWPRPASSHLSRNPQHPVTLLTWLEGRGGPKAAWDLRKLWLLTGW